MISRSCTYCKHFDRGYRQGFRCAAFPLAIPQQVILGKSFHTRPIAGDGGIQFEMVDDVPPDRAELLGKWIRESDQAR